MRPESGPILGRTTLLFCVIFSAFAVAGAPWSRAAQNPVNLDKALQEKVAQDRARSYYHYSLSRWYDDDGDLNRALAEMQEAVRFNENEPALYVGLADILARMGRTPEAIDEAQRAAKLDPKDAEPHWLLANIHLRSTEGARGRQAALDALKQAVKELEVMKEVAPNDQRAFFALGGCYMELGQTDRAIMAYERWQTLVPDADAGYTAIAQYFQRQGNADKAIEYLEKAVAIQPDSLQNMAQLAGLYTKAKREKDAVPIYRKMIALTGGNPEVKRQLAATLLDSGEFEQALNLLNDLIKEDPQDPLIRIMTGRAQIGVSRNSEAIQTLKTLVASEPGNIEAQFYLGTAYEQSGQPAEAVKIFSALVDKAGGSSEELAANRAVFQQHLAASYQDLGESQKAIAIYEEMVKSDASPRTYFLLIDAYRVDRQYDKALALGKEQFEKSPGDGNIALVYARTLADTGKIKEGAGILDQMLQKDPLNLDVYINLSQIYLQDKKFGEAEKVLRRAEQQKLDSRRVKFQLATVFERQKDFNRAESIFQEILKEDPKDAMTLNYLGYMLADRGVRLPEAVQYVQQALDLDPNNGAYLDSLGWAYFKLNDLQKAEKYLMQAVELEKKDPVIHDHLGDVYLKAGNLEKAQEFWKRSLANGGEPEEVQKIRAKLDKVQEAIRKQKRKD